MEPVEGSFVSRVLWATGVLEDALLVLMLTAMVVLAGTQIVLRNLFDGAILWADPILRVGVLWVGMTGAMVATRNDKQISVDVVSQFLPDHWKNRVRVFTDLFTSIVAAAVAWSAYRLVVEDRAAGLMTIGFVPLWVCEAILPLAFGVISVRYLFFAIRHFGMSAAEGGQQ